MSDLKNHLRSLSRQFRMGQGSTISYLETLNWPEGRLGDFIKQGILIAISPATEIRCNKCGDGCFIEPEIKTLYDGTECGIFFCSKEHKMLKFPIVYFNRWEIIPEKIEDAGVKSALVDKFISYDEAASILGFETKSAVSKCADKYGISSNGKTGQHKQLLLSSVLQVKYQMEQDGFKNEVIELRKDTNKIPEIH